jgi:hypothetical protein
LVLLRPSLNAVENLFQCRRFHPDGLVRELSGI